MVTIQIGGVQLSVDLPWGSRGVGQPVDETQSEATQGGNSDTRVSELVL